MLKPTLLMALKDLRLTLTRGAGLVQALLLGLVLVFVFSLSRRAGDLVPAQTAATIFWLASLFSLVLMSNALFSLEEESNARHGLILSPAPLAAVWAGKALASGLLVAASQLAFMPATIIFLGVEPSGPLESWLIGIAGILIVDWGLVAVGTLLGALAQGQAGRESLLSLVLFPLVIPVLLAGIRLTTGFLEGASPLGAGSWMGLALGFGALYSSVGLLLFPILYRAGD